MEGKDPIKITSTVITFVIFLTGAALCFWLYTQIIHNPSVASNNVISKLEIDQKKLEKIKASTPPSIVSPKTGYGRPNPFVPYK